MDFSLSQDQTAIRDLARQIISARANDDTLRGFDGSGDWIDRELWRELSAAGLLGLAIPEQRGGGGFGILELCILLEEVGRALAPVPAFPTLALAGLAVAGFGTPDQMSRCLPAIASGELIATAALEEEGRSDPARPGTRAEADGDGWRLSGTKHCVPAAGISDLVLVPAATDGPTALFLVDPATDGVKLERQHTVNHDAQSHMVLSDVRVGADGLLGEPGRGAAMIGWLERRAQACLAAMQVGVCEEALRRTAEYTTTRKQFERPIGSFQAVSLRAADAYIAVESMRSTMWQAAWCLDDGRDGGEETAVAKWWAAHAGQQVVHTAQHLHGGIGADTDYPIHRFFLWAKQIGLRLGGEARQLQRLGDIIVTGA